MPLDVYGKSTAAPVVWVDGVLHPPRFQLTVISVEHRIIVYKVVALLPAHVGQMCVTVYSTQIIVGAC